MATHDIFMPALSSTMTEGKIVEWLKNPGDKVERGESVLVVESDKADMDVESFQEGYLAAVLMPAGSTAPVGETIGLIVETEEEISEVQVQKHSGSPEKQNSTNQQAREEEFDDSKVVPQDSSKEAEVLSEAIEKPVQEGIKVASVVNAGRVVASPRAKKLASQKGVDLSKVRGTGPHGRIQEEDVKKATGQPVSVPWIAESDAPVNIASSLDLPKKVTKKDEKVDSDLLAGKSFGKPGEVVSFNTLQQAVNRNMESSLDTPCFRVGYSICTDSLDELYKQLKPNGITMTAILVKAVGLTLSRHPQVNSFHDSKGINYPSQINVAIAVAMEDGGLITPVLQGVDKTDLASLSVNWRDLVNRSRLKQLKPEEYSSGTFTLSNLGMFGVDRFDAILPPGTGSILAVAASRPTVVADKDNSISVRRQMQVNLTSDHRVVYGADGALFLKDLADLIENRIETLIT